MATLRPSLSELSARVKDKGGDYADFIAESPIGIFGTGENVTLLIHGFNVSYQGGQKAYRDFTDQLFTDTRQQEHWFFWPGDLSKWAPISALLYSETPKRAVACADLLRMFLNAPSVVQKGRSINLYIVAHSLGCRLALELCKLLNDQTGRYRIKLLALMAPAVPVNLVTQRARLDIAKYGGEKTLIFSSKWDVPLGLFFRPGQAGESFGWSDKLFGNRGALGRHGLKNNNHAERRLIDIPTKLGHSDYWTDPFVAEYIEQLLPNNRRPDHFRKDPIQRFETIRDDPLGRPNPAGRNSER